MSQDGVTIYSDVVVDDTRDDLLFYTNFEQPTTGPPSANCWVHYYAGDEPLPYWDGYHLTSYTPKDAPVYNSTLARCAAGGSMTVFFSFTGKTLLLELY